MKRAEKAFLSIEYAFLIIIIVVALIGMAVYLKRAVSGKMREVGDSFGHGRQYEPGVTRIPACSLANGNCVSQTSSAVYVGWWSNDKTCGDRCNAVSYPCSSAGLNCPAVTCNGDNFPQCTGGTSCTAGGGRCEACSHRCVFHSRMPDQPYDELYRCKISDGRSTCGYRKELYQ